MTRFPFLILIGVGSGLCLSGCHRPPREAANVAVVCRLTPSPPRVGVATVSVTLTDTKTGRPLPGAQVRLEGDMAHPGMTPVFGTAADLGGGRYQGPMRFTMGGDWVLVVTAVFPNKQTIERQIDVKGVEARP